jgi:hypothetical protein
VAVGDTVKELLLLLLLLNFDQRAAVTMAPPRC